MIKRYGYLMYEFIPYYLIRPGLLYNSCNLEGGLSLSRIILFASSGREDYAPPKDFYDTRMYSFGVKLNAGSATLKVAEEIARTKRLPDSPDISYNAFRLEGGVGFTTHSLRKRQSPGKMVFEVSGEVRDFTTELDTLHSKRRDYLGSFAFLLSLPLGKREEGYFGYEYKIRETNAPVHYISEIKDYQRDRINIGIKVKR